MDILQPICRFLASINPAVRCKKGLNLLRICEVRTARIEPSVFRLYSIESRFRCGRRLSRSQNVKFVQDSESAYSIVLGQFKIQEYREVIMRMTTAFTVLVLLLSGQSLSNDRQPVSLIGHWEGAINREGKVWRLWIDIQASGNELKVTVDFPDYGLYAVPWGIKREGEQVKLTHLSRGMVERLEGKIADGEIRGDWQGMNITATFVLKRVSPQPLLPYVEEEIRFQNGEAMLVGTLVKPNRPGRYGAIVFTHGSGNQTRTADFYRSRAYLFARHGIAALIYDRRGVGASKGGGDSATWANLADDALAGVQALQRRADIDPRRIGISGFSQGGWVSPLAAARSREVAFVLVGSAPAISPDEQNDYNVESLLRQSKVREDRIQSVMALRKQVRLFQHSGKGEKATLEAEIAKLKSESWFRNTLLPEVLEPYDEESLAYITFDPAPIWEKVTVPVLALWGELDLSVPSKKSQMIIEGAMKKGGNKDFTLKIFPQSGHGVSIVREQSAVWDWPRLASGYQEIMVEWVLQKTR